MENVEQKGISKEFAGAIVKALSAIKGAVKDANNPHFRSDYADLTSVIEAVKVPLSDNGIVFMQHVSCTDLVIVETKLLHTSGETYSFGALALPVEKKTAQGYGSAITYARRYALASALGVPALDDDGNEASGVGNGKAPQKAPKAPPPPQEITYYDVRNPTPEQITFLESACTWDDGVGAWKSPRSLGPKMEKFKIDFGKVELEDGDDLPENFGSESAEEKLEQLKAKVGKGSK